MITLDRIRQDILAEVEHRRAVKAEAEIALQCAEAELRVCDRCIAALRTPIKIKPPARRDLRVTVYKTLTGEPQPFEEIYRRIGRCKRRALREHLSWHRSHGTADFLPAGWYRPDLRTWTQAKAEAAE